MSTVDIKRQLDEIRVQYQLEPSLKDVYIEGTSDVNILRWFFEKKKKKNVFVYNIDSVEIPVEAYERAGLSTGSNRNKVIVLSEELSREFDKKKIRVKCIVDADLDRHLGNCRRNYILEYTDYTSTEMYFFNEAFLNKFINLVLHGFLLSPSDIISNWKRVLQRIFLIRLANESLGWGMKWFKPKTFKGYITWNHGHVGFEEERFLRSYLTHNSRLRDIVKFKKAIKHFEKKLDPDPRNNIRGHDFTYLFLWAVKRHKGNRSGFKDIETFEGALCGCLELCFVEGESLFEKLSA